MTQVFMPTHRISAFGRHIPVMLVGGAAYTKAEWVTDTQADWECGPDGWTFQWRAVTCEIEAVR